MASRLAFILAAVPLLAGLAYATSTQAAALPEAVTVTYCRGLRLDIYPPAAGRGAPTAAVLYVHGGAWNSGSRRDTGDHWPQLLPRLRGAGVLAAAMDYRLSSQAGWPAPLDDVRCAVAYLRAHARALNIDPARIELYGTSAGGQIAAMAGLESVAGVDRVVDMYGPADLAAPGWSTWLKSDIRKEFGTALTPGSPADHARAGAPRMLVVQGDCDAIVPAAQSRELVARLRAAGADVRYLEVQDAGHAFGHCGPGPTRPSVSEVLDLVTAFLRS